MAGMSQKLKRGMVIDVNLEPTKGSETGKVRPCTIVTNNVYNERVPVIQVVPLTAWSEKKSRIKTNITIEPTAENGLTKSSVADCLQTRPIDHRHRLKRIRGQLNDDVMQQIDHALKIVFALD
jgi:mRNA interferase MazF